MTTVMTTLLRGRRAAPRPRPAGTGGSAGAAGSSTSPSTAAYAASRRSTARSTSKSRSTRARLWRPIACCSAGDRRISTSACRQGLDIARRHQPAAVLADQVRQPAGPGRHHRHAARHRLEDAGGERFAVGRQAVDRVRAHQRRDVGALDPAEHADAQRRHRGDRRRRTSASVAAAAGDHQLHVGHRPHDPLERLEQREDALAPDHVGQEQHRRPRRRSRARREARPGRCRAAPRRCVRGAVRARRCATSPGGDAMSSPAARACWTRAIARSARRCLIPASHERPGAGPSASLCQRGTKAPSTSGVRTPSSDRLSPVNTGFIWWTTSNGHAAAQPLGTAAASAP